MAFHIAFVEGEVCDICGGISSNAQMLSVSQASKSKFGGTNRNYICIHRACWDKALAKADKKANAQVKLSCEHP